VVHSGVHAGGGEWVTTVVPSEVHAYTLLAGLVRALIVASVIAWLLPEPKA
jgi:hypothetical protein